MRVERRKMSFFGGQASAISNKRKHVEWLKVVTAVNAVFSEVEEVRKKWLDFKRENQE